MTRYYQVTGFQLFWTAVLVGIIAAALVIINMQVKEYLLLPVVITKDDKCAIVENYKNGEAYNCGDVGVILRNYRKQKGE